MPVAALTADEIVATLQKSSLPTVLVEGSDDLSIYRWLEEQFGTMKANVLPCNGRTVLLEVYSRRNEFANLKATFIADRDMWFFSAVPSGYSQVIWTDGYSIENDVYEPSQIEIFLTSQERTEFESLLHEVLRWFAFEVEEHRAGREAHVAVHPNRLIPVGMFALCPSFCSDRGFAEPSPSTVAEVVAKYRLGLRGKTIFQILGRLLNSPGRSPKYSIPAIVDIAIRSTPSNPRLSRIVAEVQAALT